MEIVKSDFRPLPDNLQKLRCLLNIRNSNKKSILYCIAASQKIKNLANRFRRNQHNIAEVKCVGVKFPTPVSDIHLLEEQNNVRIDVFLYEEQRDMLYLIYRSRVSEYQNHVNLMYLERSDNVPHYVYIKTLARLRNVVRGCVCAGCKDQDETDIEILGRLDHATDTGQDEQHNKGFCEMRETDEPEIPMLECDEEGCDFTSKAVTTMLVHKTGCHDDNEYNCLHRDCGAQFKSKYGLTNHMKNHATAGYFVCEECGFETTQLNNLEVHKKFHARLDEELEMKFKAKGIKCSLCEYRCDEKKKLRFHMANKHEERKVLSCPSCDYTTTSKPRFDRHVLTLCVGGGNNPAPSDVTMVTCTKCDFAAHKQVIVDNHAAKCKGAMPYTCNKCDYATAVMANLFKHAETHMDKSSQS